MQPCAQMWRGSSRVTQSGRHLDWKQVSDLLIVFKLRKVFETFGLKNKQELARVGPYCREAVIGRHTFKRAQQPLRMYQVFAFILLISVKNKQGNPPCFRP